jgi:hypothetical protein
MVNGEKEEVFKIGCKKGISKDKTIKIQEE